MEKLPQTDTLAQQIQRHHDEAQRSAGAAVEHARQAGEMLLTAKAEAGHGKFQVWFQEAGFTFSDRTARGYMRVAKELPKLPEAKRQRVANLSFRDLLGALAYDTNRVSRLPASAADTALDSAEDVPLRSAVTRAATAEHFRAKQAESRAALAASPSLPSERTPPAPAPLPQWRIELCEKVLHLARETMDSHGVSAFDIAEALNDAYCELEGAA